ncbi:MAG: TrkH family potassium uptake protein [Thermoleophilia bacterium]|nr:TrkH family potassium uptake protein [Thermoleophilia bacterium]
MPARSPIRAVVPDAPGAFAGTRRVGYLLSMLLLGISCSLAVPLVVAALYGESEVVGSFASTLFLGVALGATGLFLLRTDLSAISRREGFAIVGLGWFMVCLLGSLPYVFSGTLGPVNAWFECTSGFSGTGASVIANVEALPRGILFWRSFTHWLGGMGFVVLYLALFPLLGVGAMQLYQAEAPGLEVDRLRPRISSTARVLWLMYLGISLVLTIMYLIGGMDLFESLCQMFAVLGTGGFSTRNASIAGFESAYIDWISIVFMWLCATNFSLHWAVVTGKPGRLLRSSEWRFFTAILAILGVAVGLIAWRSTDSSFADAMREGVFEVVATGSTTGFAVADYELWIPAAQFIIFLLMFMGGCAGSTAGAMKVVRVQLFFKQAARGFFHTLHPSAVSQPRLNGRAVTPSMLRAVSAFMGLYLLTFALATAAISLTGMDFATATSSIVSMLGNIGPGLGEVGPFDNYDWVHPAGKLLLTFCMLAGRLELITVLILFSPAFWRR